MEEPSRGTEHKFRLKQDKMSTADRNSKRIRPALTKSLGWCLALRCPACGRARIFARLFQVKERCEACGAVFKREEGFFVGAIMVAVVSTEAVIVLAYLISLPFIGGHDQLVIGILLTLALLFPVAFFHHSWSIWLSFDHFIEGLPNSNIGSRQSRH
jgi:uncharacterized protein (DUF983 family)